MRTIFSIAKINFFETVRDRIFRSILGFSLLFILLDLFMADLSLGDLVMIRSFGLAGVYIFGVVVTVFLGASIVYKEIDKKTFYFVLSKPVSPRDIIIGKFLGLLSAVVLTIAIMSLVYLGVIYYEGSIIDVGGLVAIGFQLFEMTLLVGLLVFLSTITTPLTATLISILVLFTGHFFGTAVTSAERMGGLIEKFIKAAYYTLPNLEKFNIRNAVVHDFLPTPSEVLSSALYVIIYTGLLLYAAYFFLNKKDF